VLDTHILTELTSYGRIFSTWLYQFWYFGFKTAKHWGQGPETWTASELWSQHQFEQSQDFPSPMQISNAPSPASQSPNASERPMKSVSEPTPLCRWTIHIVDSVGLDDESPELMQDSTNGEWPEDWRNKPFEQKLQEGLEDNCFSTTDATELPINVDDVAAAVQRSSEEMFKQSLAFAITGRNILLVEQLLRRAKRDKKEFADIYPFHLAATYLDGSKSCCQILELLFKLSPSNFRPNSIGPTGYTVLDNLMITILRNHSRILPETVDEALKGATRKRFGGEEVDVCGRWDADSECYQALLHGGSGTIPWNWKHKFCHTSVQAVCHAISALRFDLYRCPPSGIFIKRCFCCGLKLQLPPLHSIVLTAFYLAQFGTEDEDLFGMICCLLGFIVFSRCDGIELERGQVSIDLLLGDHSTDLCTHEEVTAAEFADRLTFIAQDRLSSTAKAGWATICRILQQIEDQHIWVATAVPPAGYEDEHQELMAAAECVSSDILTEKIFRSSTSRGFRDCCEHLEYEMPKAFGRNRLLGHIWAACQCELLTYRRLSEREQWTSNRLDVRILLNSLESSSEMSIPFVAKDLMEPYCACGVFDGCDTHFLDDNSEIYVLLREKACKGYYSNLDIWDRTVFLDGTLD
jgi:hypothetical protein